jgi:hypothetical protein
MAVAIRPIIVLAAQIAAALALAGCAGVYRVDNQVESFARWTSGETTTGSTASVPAPPQTYRFERLPSRSTGATEQWQDTLEQLAQEALRPLGWTPAEEGTPAAWTIAVTSQGVRLPRAPWEGPDDGGIFWGSHVQIGVGNAGVFWSPWLLRPELPYYQMQVSIVIRSAASGRVVYETSAAHDGRWNSTPGLWRAMITAALEGFPAPPTGPRQVNLDVPR